MTEPYIQDKFKKEIEQRYPECTVIKNRAGMGVPQGWPDLTVHHKNGKAALLEVKTDKDAEHQPNQDYYVNRENDSGGFGRFIYPENKEEVLNELDSFFGV